MEIVENQDMIPSWMERTELLLGSEAVQKLRKSTVLIVGLGGVGGVAAEMICRAGVGHMVLVDRDTVNETNINRQIIATQATVGERKADVLAARLKAINPDVQLRIIPDWLDENNMTEVLTSEKFDYVVDAIDTLSPKVYLLKTCVENGIKVISSMGAGAKLDPTKVSIADISKTNYCPLAKAVRKRLSKMGVKRGVTCVYSSEESIKTSIVETDEKYKKTTTGTISYLPNLFGLFAASVVIRNLAES